MSDVLSKIKPSVRQVQAYSLRHLEAPVKINQNENPFDMPEAVKVAVNQAMVSRKWSKYPPFVPASLISKLADFSRWKPDGILVGNGSNELIEAVLIVTVERGRRVAIPQPTFTLYKLLTTVLGGETHDVYLSPELEFDVERMLDAVRQADLTLICSPNNPTGCLIQQVDLAKILKTASGLVVVDEAYHEFSRQSVVPLLAEFKNLIVLRTFSKAMAMAGLRVGYLLGDPELVREIAKAKLPYNLNVFSMTAAEATVEHFHLLKPQIDVIIQERGRVLREMQSLSGVTAYPSHANFIAFQTESTAAEVVDALYAEGVLVRDISRYPLLERFLRVSIGSPQENDLFLAALKKTMQKVQVVV